MLARQHLRRRHHRGLPAGFDHLGHGEERHHGLARADVALQEPDHAVLRPQIGADFGERCLLRARQRERERRLEPPPERPVRDMRASGLFAQSRAHEQQGELVRHEFVVGEAGRSRAGGVDVLRDARPVHRRQRLAEARQFETVARAFGDPFGQARQALQSALGCARDGALVEAFGQRIDRLDGRQPGDFVRVQDAVGVNDLADAVIELELAGDPACRADRQARAHPLGIGEEKDKHDIAGVVLDQHLERRARAQVWGRPVLRDPRLDGDEGPGNRVADLWPRPPVERRIGQVEQHVEHARALRPVEQPVEQFCVLGSDPGQRGGRGEQGVEKRRAHAAL